MEEDKVKIGPSIKIKDFSNIMQDREDEVSVTYTVGQDHLPGYDLAQCQVLVSFTIDEFNKVQQRALNEGKKIDKLIHDLVLQE